MASGGVFEKLERLYVRVLAGKKTSSGLNAKAIFTALDNVELGYKTLSSLSTNPATNSVLKDVAVRINQRRYGGSDTDKKFLEVYKKFLSGIHPMLKGVEEKSTLSSFFHIGTVIANDLSLIARNFNKIFGSYGSLETAKISHAYVLGYMHLSEVVYSWFASALFLLDTSNKERPAGYHLARLNDTLPIVLAFMNAMQRRSSSATIMTELARIQTDGKDIALTTNGQTIGDYANETDYGAEAMVALNGFVANPLLLAGQAYMMLIRWKYEQRKAEREWLQAKIARMQLQLQGVDPESEQYKNLVKTIEFYTKHITELEAKIAAYEND